MKTIISNLIKKYWFVLVLMFILSIEFGVLQILYNILLGQFISILIGIIQKYSGNVFYNDIYNFRKNKLSYVEQHPIIEPLSLKDNITLGVLNYEDEDSSA